MRKSLANREREQLWLKYGVDDALDRGAKALHALHWSLVDQWVTAMKQGAPDAQLHELRSVLNQTGLEALGADRNQPRRLQQRPLF